MTATAIKERPILFIGEMVRAILDGRKTQTRRIVKPQPVFNSLAGPLGEWTWGKHEKLLYSQLREMSPYGKPPSAYFSGERLWVRETHYVERPGYQDGRDRFILYKATDQDAPVGKWTPSIHMPRWASRITLEITDVRVERLQEISEADAEAEGVEPNWCGDLSEWDREEHGWMTYCTHYPDGCECDQASTAKESYEGLWSKINGPESWDANPWVWVVSFKRI